MDTGRGCGGDLSDAVADPVGSGDRDCSGGGRSGHGQDRFSADLLPLDDTGREVRGARHSGWVRLQKSAVKAHARTTFHVSR